MIEPRYQFIIILLIISIIICILYVYNPITKPLIPILPKEFQIWAHRCRNGDDFCMDNSIPGFVSAQNAGFTGIELDLQVNDNIFYVHHDSWEYANGLTLRDFIPYKQSNTWLWLDLKTTDFSSNDHIRSIAKELGTIVDNKKTVVELGSETAVNIFTENGFYTAITPEFRGDSKPTFLVQNVILLFLSPMTIFNTYKPPGGWMVWCVYHKEIIPLLQNMNIAAVLMY